MSLSQKKVLIVEDEPMIAQPLSDSLAAEGITVLNAADGEGGLTKALAENPDLILLDILMPKMDGLTMLKKLREKEEGKKMQVVVLTNLDQISKVSDAASAGTTDYLIKSDWKIDDIITLVKEKVGIAPAASVPDAAKA